MNKQAIEKMDLGNGMRVVMVEMPGVNSLTVLAMVGIGSRFEGKKVAGISHFLEHLPFKGTANYPTSMDVASAIDSVGGKHNAFTSKEYTGYWVKVASGQWQLAMDMVSDLLLTARLRGTDIAREKGVIVEEINMYEDNPQAKVSQLFDELVFRGNSLAGPVIGYKETVSKLSRMDLIGHWDKWYGPENVVIGMVGELGKLKSKGAELEDLVEEYFSKGNERKGGGRRKFGLPGQPKPRLEVFYKDTEQAHFHLGFPGLKRGDEDRYVLSVLVTLFGGNSSSRLFNEIREKRGLAYYAYASADFYHDAGSVYAFEGVALNKVDEAIRVTIGEFVKAAEMKSITDGEVERAKEFVVGKLSLDLEDSATLAGMVVRRLLLENKLETLDEIVAQVRAVELEEVRELAGRLFDLSKLNLAVVGPYKQRERFAKLLK